MKELNPISRYAAATLFLVSLCILVRPALAHGRYGGSSYAGEPTLSVTASLVAAGGGAANFSITKALVSMVGEELTRTEVSKLTKQYGKKRVKAWITVFDFAVKDALRIATSAGVKLPPPALSGKDLAATLVTAGVDKDGTFNVELLLDKAVSHKIHEQVMDNIDKRYGKKADADYHRITNQAMYDLAHALGANEVKLNGLH
jgi:hypothetical protein